jgi:predicted sugar kinase
MGTTAESLCERVDELIRAHKREPLLSTTGTRAAIGELMSRIVGLEEAMHEIALEIQRREDSEEGLSADARSAGDWRLSTPPIM